MMVTGVVVEAIPHGQALFLTKRTRVKELVWTWWANMDYMDGMDDMDE
jgi:hypothetical protein